MSRIAQPAPASTKSLVRAERLATGRADRNEGTSTHAPVTILVVGQTPPPYGGQAMMINRLVQARFTRIRIKHVRMAFSSSMREVGRFAGNKLLHLVSIICRALVARVRYRASVLYFPPAGPNTNPVLRDIALLLVLRTFFSKTVFHFRAAGVSEFVESRPWFFRLLAKLAYGGAAGAIQLSDLNPPDAAYFGARRLAIIPNGLEDAAAGFQRQQRSSDDALHILFVGVVSQQKGAFVLLQAASRLKAKGRTFRISFVGEFGSDDGAARMRALCDESGLRDCVSFTGPKVGDDKWAYFRDADILCFPTFFEAESFGNVAVEGMMFELPVVATRWRGVPSIVVDGVTGLLVPPRDADALAAALERLLGDRSLCARMGRAGRQRYCEEYGLQRHLERMETFLAEIATA